MDEGFSIRNRPDGSAVIIHEGVAVAFIEVKSIRGHRRDYRIRGRTVRAGHDILDEDVLQANISLTSADVEYADEQSSVPNDGAA